MLEGRSYDPLDHRCEEFEADVRRFEAAIDGVEAELQAFITAAFAKSASPTSAIRMLEQFQSVFERPSLQDFLVRQVR